MKSLTVTVLIITACFLGYDYFLAPPGDRVVFSRPVETPIALPAPAVVETKVPEVVPAPAKTPPSSPPAIQPPKPTEKAPTDSSQAFHAPKLESIEALTGGWQKVPKTAFPRPVNLLKDATFNLSFGASTVRAGTQVVALSMDNGLLIVTPNEASVARKSVPVDDTDLKSRLNAVYEQWKTERIAEARRQFEERQRQPKAASATTSFVDAEGKPARSADGAYPILLDRMRSGSPTDITPASIIRWGNVEMETIKGIQTWVIPVTYRVKTPFGVRDAETLAHIQKGQVTAWIYKGSEEPVP